MFTGFVNVYDAPWPSRVKNLEVSPAYAQANERTSVVLDKIKLEQQRIEAEQAALRTDHDERVAREKELKAKLKTMTADEQRKQIEEVDRERRRMEEAKKHPGISPQFHGYPSIPVTPPDLRRQQKLERQQQLKEELERQAASNRQLLEAKRQMEQQQDQLMLRAAEAVGRDREQSEETKKKKNREEMRMSWKQAEEYKQAQSVLASPSRSLETSTISQHSWSEYRDRFQEYRPVLTLSSPLTSSVPYIPRPTISPVLTIPDAVSTISSKMTPQQRKEIAARLKEAEDRKAKESIEKQLQKHQEKNHSSSPGAFGGTSPTKSIGKSNHLRSVGGLISQSIVRSYSQPHIGK